MTVQAQESLDYRDQKYALIGAPFNNFLKEREDLKMDAFSTAHWRGYQGYWLLRNDKLFLTNLESENYTFYDIFGNNDPILADWFSGELEFGIGNHHPDHWWGFYDNYVWMEIENGIVIKKKIIKRFYEESQFTFGKYKGRTFEQVINGKIRDNKYITIKDFIENLFKFFKDQNYGFKIQSPLFQVADHERQLIKEIKNYNIEFLLTQTFIAISSKIFWENSTVDERASKLSALFEKILGSDFNTFFTLTKKDMLLADVAECSILINGDVQYLNWALKNVDYFAIPPDQLSKEFSILKLHRFNIKRLNELIFEYEPILEKTKYKFPETTLKINREKFEKLNNVIYSPEDELYFLNLPETEILEQFGHYLNENYIKKKESSDKYRNYRYFDSNDWLRDAAGTDDPEIMNDVYWNLD